MTEPAAVPEPVTVERRVELDAPLDEVWEALTSPDELARWLGAEVAVDLEPGGVGRVVDPDGTVRQVLVTDVEPGHRLAWHWWPEGGDLSSVAIIAEPVDTGTRVVVTETVIVDPAPWRAQARAGRPPALAAGARR